MLRRLLAPLCLLLLAGCPSEDPDPPAAQDTDRDGLTDTIEAQVGTDPSAADTDGDGKGDKAEVGDPAAPADSDGDGTIDALEPSNQDADQDCLPDEADPANTTPQNGQAAGDACSGVGACAIAGALECDGRTLVCSVDPGGSASPATSETCDGIDNDCNGDVDEGFDDFDSDGDADCVDTDDDDDGDPDSTDCEPLDPSISSLHAEICNGEDDNCDQIVDEGFDDFDADGEADCVDTDDDDDGDPDSTDCEPLDPTISNLALEVCNGEDDNCDQVEDEGFPNYDMDNEADCVDTDDDDDGDPDSTDCAPLDESRYHGATEICDTIDQDCDGLVDDVGASATYAPSGSEVLSIALTNGATVATGPFTLPIFLPAGLVDLSTMAPDAADLRLRDADGAALPFWLEGVDRTTGDLRAWVRLDNVAASSSRTILADWGSAASSVSTSTDTFELFWTYPATVAPALITWGGVADETYCNAVTAANATVTAAGGGTADFFKPDQGATRMIVRPDRCFDPDNLAVRARLRMITNHFDRDLSVGFALYDDPAEINSGRVGRAVMHVLQDEDQTRRVRYRNGCAQEEEVISTTLVTSDTNDLELALHRHGAQALAADGVFAFGATGRPATCATPLLRGNTDSWQPGEIHYEVDFVQVYKKPVIQPAVSVCAGGVDTTVADRWDSDGDLMPDPADPDADEDGLQNRLDCGPITAETTTIGMERCDGNDDDCDGAIDNQCSFSIDFSDAQDFLQLTPAFSASGCSLPQVTGGGVYRMYCPNNRSSLAYPVLPYADGTRSVHVAFDLTTSNWGDIAPRVGFQWLTNEWPAGAIFHSQPAYTFLISDPVDQTQGGRCPTDLCLSIGKDGPAAALLADTPGVVASGVTYHVEIDMDATTISMTVSGPAGILGTLSAADTEFRAGYPAFLCAEARCDFDNLIVQYGQRL